MPDHDLERQSLVFYRPFSPQDGFRDGDDLVAGRLVGRRESRCARSVSTHRNPRLGREREESRIRGEARGREIARLRLQGPQGPPVRFRGDWINATAYALGDAVFFNGSSYISLITSNTGNSPSNGTPWSLLVQQGAAGATGATLALRLLREQFLTPESRKRNAFEALSYYAGLGITGYPETFVLDGTGKIVRKIVGPARWDTPEAISWFRGVLKPGAPS